MAALTLTQLSELLEIYTPADGSFLPRLNQALARLSNMGVYRDLTVQYALTHVDGWVSLPDDADGVLHAMVDRNPVTPRSLWHDYKNGVAGVGLIDSGFAAVMRPIPADNTGAFFVTPSTESATQIPFDLSDGGELQVVISGETRRFEVTLSGSNTTELLFDEVISAVHIIRFDGLVDRYDIRVDEFDPATTVATVGPGSGVARYRMFRAPMAQTDSIVHVLCKRSFQMLKEPNDVTYVGNINAIKNALMAVLSEDSGDIERADYLWKAAAQMMDEEAAATRGAAIPTLNVDPFGVGGQMGIPALM